MKLSVVGDDESKTSPKSNINSGLKRLRVFCHLFVRKKKDSQLKVIALVFIVMAIFILQAAIRSNFDTLLNEQIDTYYETTGRHRDRYIDSLRGQARIDNLLPDAQSQSKMKVISKDPYIFLYENFLTQEECTTLVDAAEKKGLQRSQTGDFGSNAGVSERDNDVNTIRTSHDVYLSEEVMGPTNTRVYDLLGLGTEEKKTRWSEGAEIKRYSEGEYYMTHHDATHDEVGRIATAIIFFSKCG